MLCLLLLTMHNKHHTNIDFFLLEYFPGPFLLKLVLFYLFFENFVGLLLLALLCYAFFGPLWMHVCCFVSFCVGDAVRFCPFPDIISLKKFRASFLGK
jgi:hypothetical protein